MSFTDSDLDENDFLKVGSGGDILGSDLSSIASSLEASDQEDDDAEDNYILRDMIRSKDPIGSPINSTDSSTTTSSEFTIGSPANLGSTILDNKVDNHVLVNTYIAEPTYNSYYQQLCCRLQTKILKDSNKIFIPGTSQADIINVVQLICTYITGGVIAPDALNYVQHVIKKLNGLS